MLLGVSGGGRARMCKWFAWGSRVACVTYNYVYIYIYIERERSLSLYIYIYTQYIYIYSVLYIYIYIYTYTHIFASDKRLLGFGAARAGRQAPEESPRPTGAGSRLRWERSWRNTRSWPRRETPCHRPDTPFSGSGLVGIPAARGRDASADAQGTSEAPSQTCMSTYGARLLTMPHIGLVASSPAASRAISSSEVGSGAPATTPEASQRHDLLRRAAR